MEKCLGCEIIAGNIKTPGGLIYEDAHWTITHATSSNGAPLLGMLILQPKRHCTQLADLTTNEIKNLGLLLHETCKALDDILHPVKTYACSFGEGVGHVHFMIIPRMEGMPIGAELLKQVIEEHKWECSYNEASDLANRVQSLLPQLFK